MMLIPLVTGTVLIAVWVAYPIIRRRAAPRLVSAQPAINAEGAVTAVIVTRDDPAVIVDRVENLHSSCPGLSEILVVVDQAIADKAPEYRITLGDRATVIIGDPPGGKASGLNAGVRRTRSPLVLLTDSWQQFLTDAYPRLVDTLVRNGFAAVSGRVVNQKDDLIMRAYWKYENAIRTGQSNYRSLVTTSGAITLLRREHWHPIPAGAICDDLFITLGLAMRGERVGYVPEARAIDPRVYTRKQLLQKRIRTLTGLWQLVVWRPRVLLPWQNPIWIDFVFHKLGRLATPYLALLFLLGLAWEAVHALPATFSGLRMGLLFAMIGGTILVASFARSGIVWWTLALLFSPLVATWNAARRDWGIWRHHHLERDLGSSPGVEPAEATSAVESGVQDQPIADRAIQPFVGVRE